MAVVVPVISVAWILASIQMAGFSHPAPVARFVRSQQTDWTPFMAGTDHAYLGDLRIHRIVHSSSCLSNVVIREIMIEIHIILQ